MCEFSDINFKYTDAEEEKLYAPELIDQAYVDINGILAEIEEPEKFLVIGPKGSGKTALLSKLQIMGNNQWDLFVDFDELEQFEYPLLDKCGAQKGSSIGGALTVWQLILSIRLLSIFLKDVCFKEKNKEILKFHDTLIAYGLADSESIISIVQYTSRRGIFGKIKSAVSEVKGEKSEEANFKVKDPAAIFAAIKEVLKNLSVAESRYFLLLDSNSRFTLNPSKYAVHINAFRKLLNRPRWAILDNLFILHQYFFGRSDDFS